MGLDTVSGVHFDNMNGLSVRFQQAEGMNLTRYLLYG